MKNTYLLGSIILSIFCNILSSTAQNIIPIDTSNWEINAQSYVVENYEGKNSIYIFKMDE